MKSNKTSPHSSSTVFNHRYLEASSSDEDNPLGYQNERTPLLSTHFGNTRQKHHEVQQAPWSAFSMKGRDPEPYKRKYFIEKIETTISRVPAPSVVRSASVPQESGFFSSLANFFKSLTFTCVPVEVREIRERAERLDALRLSAPKG